VVATLHHFISVLALLPGGKAMKSIACALALLLAASFVGVFGGCSEDNDKKAKINSGSAPPGIEPAAVPVGVEGNKKLAEAQQKKNMSRPNYPKPGQQGGQTGGPGQ
jgi:hypothetical protein